MVREDILAGLKQAVSRGESLRQAMMSFYKAGYRKEEIEEAARFLQNEKIQEETEITYSGVQESKKPIQDNPQYNSQYLTAQIQQKPVQNITPAKPKSQISNYSYEQKKSWLGWIILISGTLVIIALVILAIIFKEQVTNFISNLWG